MERYVQQLLDDIDFATKNVAWPFQINELELHDWISAEEEDRTAPRRSLEEWTGIKKVQLPPQERLKDKHIHLLLKALNEMLNEYNWLFVLQLDVPERIQYETIRCNFNQEAKVLRWNMGFFNHCRPGTQFGTCTLGEYCQCQFYEELTAGFIEEDLTPEEERARYLEIELTHIKRKYGDEWKKYYPYHLDPEYDDEDGNPYDYGYDNEYPDEDDWWKT